MSHEFISRLEIFGQLPESDRALLRVLTSESHRYEPGVDVIGEGDEPADVHLVVSGYACRYKMLKNGKRQIVAYLLPGDFCDLHVFILDAMDHSISTLSSSNIVRIPRKDILLMLERPLLAKALLMTTLVDEAVLREWITNIGQRSAFERLAHLFCELFMRMKVIGAVSGNTFELPINQTVLADTVGLSLVHVNKSLKRLRDKGAITFRGGRLIVSDMELLQKLCGFKANYLHFKAAWSGSFENNSRLLSVQ